MKEGGTLVITALVDHAIEEQKPCTTTLYLPDGKIIDTTDTVASFLRGFGKKKGVIASRDYDEQYKALRKSLTMSYGADVARLIARSRIALNLIIDTTGGEVPATMLWIEAVESVNKLGGISRSFVYNSALSAGAMLTNSTQEVYATKGTRFLWHHAARIPLIEHKSGYRVAKSSYQDLFANFLQLEHEISGIDDFQQYLLHRFLGKCININGRLELDKFLKTAFAEYCNTGISDENRGSISQHIDDFISKIKTPEESIIDAFRQEVRPYFEETVTNPKKRSRMLALLDATEKKEIQGNDLPLVLTASQMKSLGLVDEVMGSVDNLRAEYYKRNNLPLPDCDQQNPLDPNENFFRDCKVAEAFYHKIKRATRRNIAEKVC